MKKNYRVTRSFDNPEKNRCVDIVQATNGTFMFQEWRREPEDISGWFLLQDSSPHTFGSEEEAILKAKLAVFWFKELDT
jgi:hypothetical protein